jgi:prolyl-tRNA editing enzyme YbaK/EbsC (Cys-tRNA(Pro) deacylase)
MPTQPFKLGTLLFEPVQENLALVAPIVAQTLTTELWKRVANTVLVAQIDPDFSDSVAFCENYHIPQTQGANCLILQAKRGNHITYTACLVPVNKRAHINGLIRRYLHARQVSLAEKDFAVKACGMEYGGITVIGLPKDWPILIEKSLTQVSRLVIGAGTREAKLVIPGNELAAIQNAVLLEEMCK